jgi:ATP-dependent DNA helicase RecG
MNLDSKLSETLTIRKKRKNGLKRLGLTTVGDLLYHFPTRYRTEEAHTTVNNLSPDMDVVLSGKIQNLKTKKSHQQGISMATGTFVDETGSLDVVWFHQPYIAKMLNESQTVQLTGTISKDGSSLQITNPEYRKLSGDAKDSFSQQKDASFILPVYPESEGVTSRWLYHSVRKLLANDEVRHSIPDPLPESLRERLNLPDARTAFTWIHSPKQKNHATVSRKRFAFEEVFAVQIVKKQQRYQYNTQETFPIQANYDDLKEFLDRFDFDPTDAQKRSIEEVLKDFRQDTAMNRLLEGDVGSGKTFVAAATTYAAVTTPPKGREYGHLQTAYMAPTEILARQQFQSFVDYFAHLPIEMALITGSGCRKFPSKIDDTKATDISRNQLLKWIKDGVVSVVFGTHSLIQDDIQFDNLAYTIIDEQHRFGVNQRKQIVEKDGPLPHFLAMTATPIPRTLALTLHGDLDLSIIDELPPGRKTAKTKIIKESQRNKIYTKIEKKLSDGQQAYVVCPRIEEPDPDDSNQKNIASVDKQCQKLKNQFENYSVAPLHGQMSDTKKRETMKEFADGEIDVLVATSVIEVGVNVPQATTIIIENAEQFGLAQLHQLRGRVQRSNKTPHCFLFADMQTEKTTKRLHALEKFADGFDLAEKDLEIRGPGALVGKRQSGMADIAMDALKNKQLVTLAAGAAQDIINEDPDLTSHQTIQDRTHRLKDQTHLA